MELQQAHGNVLLSVARSQGDQPHDQEQKTISALVLAITGGNRRASGGRDQPDPALLIAKRAAGLIQVPSRPRVCRKRERLPSSGCIESDPAPRFVVPEDFSPVRFRYSANTYRPQSISSWLLCRPQGFHLCLGEFASR